jgi:diketogulonate reductase-like aldo/keto reductase
MKIPMKKLKNGFELPVYGMGLWMMGGGRWERDTSRDAEDVDAIRTALDLGVTHFDTAEMYGDGHAEELLGLAAEGVDRSKLLLATKVFHNHMTYDGVLKAAEASLERLKTTYIDLYLLHSYPDPGMPIAKTMQAMDRLVDEGVVKNIGVCNLSPDSLTEAQAASKHKLVCNQVHYNLRVREAEARGVLEQSIRDDVMVVAWRPLEKGGLEMTGIVQELAQKYDKTPAQIAINWLISQDNVAAISKTSRSEHLKENLGAIGWTMDKSDIERLRAGYPDQLQVSDRVPLE